MVLLLRTSRFITTLSLFSAAIIATTTTTSTVLAAERQCNLTCQNSGECRLPGQDFVHSEGALEGTEPQCDCPKSHVGALCEIPCNIPCFNGGKCQIPSKTTTTTTTTTQHECICPTGFLGHSCEVQVEICKDDHKCLFGSKCVLGSSTSDRYHRYTCDCSSTDHTSCEDRKIYCSSGVLGGPVNYQSFCVNGGTCVQNVEPGDDGMIEHMGCKCPDEWYGEYCEYPSVQAKAQQNGIDGSDGGLSRGGIVSVVLASFFAVLAIGLVWRRAMRRRAANREVVFGGSEMDDDGQVQDSEFI